MPIRFSCPECDKPLVIATRKAGTHVACPACRSALTVPSESNRARLRPAAALPESPCEDSAVAALCVEVVVDAAASPVFENPLSDNLPIAIEQASAEGDKPSAAVAATSPRRRRLTAAMLAAGLCAAIGLGALVGFAALGGGSGAEPLPEQPAAPQHPPETLAAARPAQDRDSQSEPVVAATEPEHEETVEPERRPLVPPTAPPSLTLNPNQTPAPPPLTQKQEDGKGAPPAPPADKPAAEKPPEKPAAKPEPPQPKKKPADLVLERLASKRRSQLSDDELRKQLLLPPEVDVEAVRGAVKSLVSVSAKAAGTGLDLVPLLVARRADLMGLPLRPTSQTRLSKEEALNLQVLSQQLRLHVETSMPGIVNGGIDLRPDPEILRKRLLDNPGQVPWRAEAIPALRQLLMHEHRNVRMILVEILAKIKGPQASAVLAERAVFDLHADVRDVALVALADRPAGEYEATLLGGFRYPWPAAADHAAEALVALNLRESVPKLVPLLDLRDLSDPYVMESGKTRLTVVPELVRLNHLRNCLLCHAASFSPIDPVRQLVPHGEQRVPLPSSGQRGSSSGGGYSKGGGGGGWSGGSGGAKIIVPTWVRADITYFKQDFTVVQPVPNHGRLWPPDQRYDYMVRLRPLNNDELRVWQDKLKDFRPSPPQRQSLMYALTELTGENPGSSPEDWKRLYSPITGQRLPQPLEPKDQARYLSECLTQAPPLRQAELVLSFKERRGSAYDTALALAMPDLKPEVQKLSRGVLADRFHCLPLNALRDRLGDPDAEIRRAAVKVCERRKLKALAPELINLLDDQNPSLMQQAHQLLQQFAGRDFGPRRGADAEQREQAIAAWRDWHAQRDRKQNERKGP